MARTCRFSLGGSAGDRLSGDAEWRLDESELLVTPEGRGPLIYSLRELRGIAGDGYQICLSVAGVGDAGEAWSCPASAPRVRRL